MPQRSKIIRSGQEWKVKAIRRGWEAREYRKTIKRREEIIAELKIELEEFKKKQAEKKIESRQKRAARKANTRGVSLSH
jgi:hypothetical protein